MKEDFEEIVNMARDIKCGHYAVQRKVANAYHVLKYQIVCHNCGRRIACDTYEEAIEKWNKLQEEKKDVKTQ